MVNEYNRIDHLPLYKGKKGVQLTCVVCKHKTKRTMNHCVICTFLGPKSPNICAVHTNSANHNCHTVHLHRVENGADVY